MKKSIGEIMSDPRIWEMSEEEKQRGRQRNMEIAKREMESGMLTYKAIGGFSILHQEEVQSEKESEFSLKYYD